MGQWVLAQGPALGGKGPLHVQGVRAQTIARGTSVRLTHDRFDFGRGGLELPSGALELISHSLAQRGEAWLKALHFSQHFID